MNKDHPIRSRIVRFAIAQLGGLALFAAISMFFPNQKLIIITHTQYLALISFLFDWVLFSKKRIDRPDFKMTTEDGLILASSASWVGIRVGTSIYSNEEEYEKFICNGEVINIQSNGLVQIQIISSNDHEEEEILKAIKASAKDNILIKPGVAK